MKTLIQKIMTNSSPSKVEEVERAIAELQARRRAVDSRLIEIAVNADHSGHPGKARKAAMLTGTPADLVALDAEQAELLAERNQALPAQEAALLKSLEQAKAAEAAVTLPSQIKALAPAIARHEKALNELQQAQAQVDDLVASIIQSRKAVGNDAPAVAEHLAKQVADLRGIGSEPDRVDRYNLARARLFADLGAELPERARPDYQPFKSEPKEQPTRRESEFWNGSGRAA